MAAIADFTGEGEAQVALVDAMRLRVVTRGGDELASREVRAGAQVLRAADVDGDGRAAILAGFGRTREHPGGEAYAAIYRLRDGALEEELVVAPKTERAEIVSILTWPRRGRVELLVAYFDSRYFVSSFVARRAGEGWALEPHARVRMATSYAIGDVRGDGSAELVVGRVYGDAQLEEGDAFVLEPSGARTRIPTTRGVRGLALVDTDGDGRAEVYLGDGWHQNYGQLARGQLTVARLRDDAFVSEPPIEVPGQYTLWQVEPAHVGGEVALVARGSAGVFLFERGAQGWTHTQIAGAARHVVVGDLDGEAGDEVLVLSEPSEIIRFD
jgi:hypothetical protein